MFTIIHIITPNAEQRDFSPIITESKTRQIGKTTDIKMTAKRNFLSAVSTCLSRASLRLMSFTVDNDNNVFTLIRNSNGEIAESIQVVDSNQNAQILY